MKLQPNRSGGRPEKFPDPRDVTETAGRANASAPTTQLDFRMLKIAGEFIEGMVDNSVDRSIVHSIMCLAQDEGMVTVAEFVSSEDILREVTHLGITYAQGYHIGRSVPLAEFIATYLTTSKNHEEEE